MGADAFVLAGCYLALSMQLLQRTSAPMRYFWPLVGWGAYSLVDLFYFYLFANADPGFCLGEVGYFAGYLLTALGAYFMLEQSAKESEVSNQ
jgi:hypothetical protein